MFVLQAKNPLPQAVPVCGLKLVITKSISHTFTHLLFKSVGYGESYFYTKQPYLPVPVINTNHVPYFRHRHRQTTVPCSSIQILDCVFWKLCHLPVFAKPRSVSIQVSTYLIFSIFSWSPFSKSKIIVKYVVSNAHEVWLFFRGKCFWGEGLRELSEGNTGSERFTESQKIFSRKL